MLTLCLWLKTTKKPPLRHDTVLFGFVAFVKSKMAYFKAFWIYFLNKSKSEIIIYRLIYHLYNGRRWFYRHFTISQAICKTSAKLTILTRETGFLFWRVFIQERNQPALCNRPFISNSNTAWFSLLIQIISPPGANSTSSSTKNSSFDRVLLINKNASFSKFPFFNIS